MSDKRIDIPNHAGWSEGVIEDLCSVVSRGTAPVYVEDSAVRAIGQRCVAARGFRAEFARPHSEKAMNNVLRAVVGDVLLNSTGTGTIGRSCVFDDLGTFIVDGHVTVLRAPDYETGVWLDAVLRTPWAQGHLERFCYSGSTNQIELNNTALRESSLPLPDGKERKGIAKALSAVDALIKVAEISIEKLKLVKQGLLHDLLTRGIDLNGELRPLPSAGRGTYAGTALGLLPNEWRPGRIIEYLDESEGLKPGPFGSSIKKETYAETGFKVYGQEQVISGDQNAGDYFVPLRKFQELNDFAVREGDVLISLVGTVGKVLLLRAPLQPGLINPRLMRLRCSYDKAIPEFISLLVGSTLYARQISRFAGGGTMPVINKSILSAIMTPIIGVDEQRRIVDVWESLARRLENEVMACAKLREQKLGLMDDLLTGRVRVTCLLNE